MLCVFCNSLLPSKKPEHVVSAFLGGRRSSRNLLCDLHNETFGGSFERHAAKGLASLANMLGVRSGRRRAPPQIQGIKGPDKSETYTLLPGAKIIQPKAKVEIDESENGQVRIRIRADATKGHQIHKILESFAAKYGTTLDETILAQANVTQIQLPSPIELDITLGPDLLRSLSKISLLLLATKTGTVAVRGSAFEDVRRFIEIGGPSSEFIRMNSAAKLPTIVGLHEPAVAVHRFLVYATREFGCFATIELYGCFLFTGLLSKEWNSENISVGHSVNPITEQHFVAYNFSSSPISIDQFATIKGDQVATNGRLDNLLSFAIRRMQQQALEEMVARCINESIGKSEDVITEEMIAKLTMSFAEQFVATQKGYVLERQLTIDDVIPRTPTGEPDGPDE